MLVTKSNDYVMKAKGLDSKLLSYEDYKDMYKLGKEVVTTRKESIKSIAEGEVKIVDNKITLSPTAYTKRTKLCKKGLWFDTRPLVIGKRECHTLTAGSVIKYGDYRNYDNLNRILLRRAINNFIKGVLYKKIS